SSTTTSLSPVRSCDTTVAGRSAVGLSATAGRLGAPLTAVLAPCHAVGSATGVSSVSGGRFVAVWASLSPWELAVWHPLSSRAATVTSAATMTDRPRCARTCDMRTFHLMLFSLTQLVG